jgi:branched-chain amino acid transport system ATP-binding protein
MSDAVLELRDVDAWIGASRILQEVSFDVPRGQVTVIVGRNGVGKTTTLRAVLGLVRRAGAVVLDGRTGTCSPT